MFNIGSQELLVILVLVFLLFGPRHIPEVARALGKGLGDVQRALRGVEENVRRASDELPRGASATQDVVGAGPRGGAADPEVPASPPPSGRQPGSADAAESLGGKEEATRENPGRAEPT